MSETADQPFRYRERTDLTTEAELRAEITRLEWAIRAVQKTEQKGVILISLVPHPDNPRAISIVVTGPAYKPSVLLKAGRHAMALYLEVMRSIRTKPYDEAIARVKAAGTEPA